ncbi:chitobiase/beta-hexosaminidase C-terminal domain-containing protein [Belliella sp. DSM 111904]|uniref:Chitobiase/beta-hexosaminidase C-terminal domain-containing protein n=1 Tax=Belliella filtrata TaxID=2923435 RepID=A0ABS9UYQ8_9BACT|nr:chitobiase/beta-hexosaminidase C-terminal domain-containing protein [Belliella filtrata]MCH7409306.1 chitobiase/beta-hexosaminidase C-terminal domain-containing protein [Belliella filtrata]
MKKHLQNSLIILLILLSGMTQLMAQTTVVAGWTFGSVAGSESPLANQGTSNNLGVSEITLTNANPTGYVAGFSGGRAITSNGWNNFTVERYWQITVNTSGYENLTLSSRQQSSNTGPKDFKAQYSLDGNSWQDIPNTQITVANNLTTGFLNKIPLPQDLNNRALIYIRWLNTSDVSVNDGTTAGTGTNRITEIFVEGESSGVVLPEASAPTFSPNGGSFDAAQEVSLSSSTVGASIYYTLDGSTPNLGSTVYTSPILISTTTTISAIAIADGFEASAVATADFTIDIPTIPSSGIPYTQNFAQFIDLTSPVTSFGANEEWSFSAGVLNYAGLFGSGTAGGFRGGDVLGYQHTGSSGIFTATLSLENTTGQVINSLEISYVGKTARLDQTRFPEWTVSVNGETYADLSYSTSVGEDITITSTIADLNILPGEAIEIIWSSDRGFNASGGSRQIGLAQVNISIPVVLEPISFINWDFTNQPGNQVSTAGTVLAQGVEARDFARGSGINPAAAGNSISSNGWNAGDNRYFTFGFNIAPDKLIDLTLLQIGSTSSNTGPRDMALTYSGDGFNARLAEWTHTGTFVNQEIDLSGLQNLSGDVEFRIISTSDISANGGSIAAGGTARVTNFFPGALPVSFTGIIKDADGVIVPRINVNPTELNFGAVSIAGNSPVLSYELSAENLENNVNVSATAPYLVSKDGNNFTANLTYSVEELIDVQTVFVQLSNANIGNFNTTISHQTAGTLPVSLSVNASVFDPFNISENFNNTCPNLPAGWETVSVLGDQIWECTTFGRAGTTPTASAPFGLQINGFAGGAVLNEDWIISAPYDLTGFNIPLMSFWSRVAFQGPRLKLLISTDYNGGNPNNSTWTELSDRFASADQWTFSGQVDLSAYLDQTVRIAFLYESSPETGAARWTLDDFELINSDIPAEPFFSNNIGNVDYWHFGIVPVGTVSSNVRAFNFGLSNPIADLSISAGEGFELSKDGSNFTAGLTYTLAELGSQQTVQVRFAPQSEGAFASPINFQSGDIEVTRGYLTGSTINKDKTFDVVNWNIEWFGSTNSGQGPTNVDQQLQNVKTIIENLDADVYAFQEITSLSKFTELADALPGYGMAVSPAASAGGEYAEEAQKLTYLFKLATVDTLQTRVLLQDVPSNLLVNYPSTPDRFWASGRLPYLMDIRANIDGTSQHFTLVNLHTRSNGGGESAANPRYAMRRYDVNVLKDSLDTYYADVPLIILGDFNDDLDETVADQTAPTVNTSETSFINYINDSINYTPITISLSNAGLRTFPSFENVIDHQIISNELDDLWIVNSERIVAPYDLIPNYNTTTSDHLPIKTRFLFKCSLEAPLISTSTNEICAGSSVTFELAGGSFSSVVGWEISTDDGATWTLIEGTAELYSITLETIEEATLIRAIVDAELCEPVVTSAAEINVSSLPQPFIYFESSKLFTLEGSYTFKWYKNGQLIATTSINETRIQGAGEYTVEISDESGCAVTSEKFSFPVKGNSNQIRVFPNPARQVVNVELRKVEGLQNIELRSATGLLIESQLTQGNGLVQFNTSSLAAGIYLIYVREQNGATSVQRLVVR